MKRLFRIVSAKADTRPKATQRGTSVPAFAMAGLGSLALLALAGCHTDMWVQPKVHKPLQASDFFPDGRSARPFVAHTVARGTFHTDDALYKGIANGKLVDTFPFPITKADLDRGQDQFNTYCSPCHGKLGYGDGMIAKRGFNIRKKPGNYHEPRLRKLPIGHYFDVITNGFGVMYSYASRVQDVNDRWRIVAWIRTLQLSQHATPADAAPGVDVNNLPEDRSGLVPEKPNGGTSAAPQRAPAELGGTVNDMNQRAGQPQPNPPGTAGGGGQTAPGAAPGTAR